MSSIKKQNMLQHKHLRNSYKATGNCQALWNVLCEIKTQEALGLPIIGTVWLQTSNGFLTAVQTRNYTLEESSSLFEIIVIKVPQHADKTKVISPIFFLLSGTQLLSAQAKHHFKCTRLKYAQNFFIHQNQTDPDVLTGDFVQLSNH